MTNKRCDSINEIMDAVEYKIAIEDLSGIQNDYYIEVTEHDMYPADAWYAIDFAIKCMEKLQKVEQIISDRSYTDEIGNAMYYTDGVRVAKIKEVLDGKCQEETEWLKAESEE